MYLAFQNRSFKEVETTKRKLLKTFNDDVLINHHFSPKHLGVTLDTTLTFQGHLTNLSKTLETRTRWVLVGSFRDLDRYLRDFNKIPEWDTVMLVQA